MLEDGGLQSRILLRWLETCPEDVRFIDVVVFYLLPQAYAPAEINEPWIAKVVGWR